MSTQQKLPTVKYLVFRKLTDNDFFCINKLPGTELRGGGESYIDISTSAVSPRNWRRFFRPIPMTKRYYGPRWGFKVFSLGPKKGPQTVHIGQRRPTTYSIRSQKLQSKKGKRVYAWRPNLTGFPKPRNPRVMEHVKDLCVYIARLNNGEYWAGWFQRRRPKANWDTNPITRKIFHRKEGFLVFKGQSNFDTSDVHWPFRNLPASRHSIIGAVSPNQEETLLESAAKGQGFRMSSKERARIEEIAMKRAKLFFRNRGYNVRDVHKNHSYDLLCRRGQQKLFVEVKGTTGDGSNVLLTGAEVRFAQTHQANMVLFLVHSIHLHLRRAMKNGRRLIRRPWVIRSENLLASRYVYKVR